MNPSLKKRLNVRFPGVENDARQTRRRMMDDRFCPEYFHTYRVTREEAISLLSPHYKLAHQMPRNKLERKLNYRAWKLMEASNVLCFCRFSVVRPFDNVEVPAGLDGPLEVDKPVAPTEPPYQMMRDQEEWLYQFHGKF